MSRRLIGLALLPVLMALVGCTGRRAPSTDVVLALQATPVQVEKWQKVIDAFKEATKIGVTLENHPDGKLFDALRKTAGSGKGPDVVLMDSTRFPEFAARGAFEGLDDRLKQQTAIEADDFIANAWRCYQYQGSTYGLPNDIATIGVVFSKNQLELASMDVPKPNWTWSEYVAAAKALTVDRDGNGRNDVWGTVVCPWWQVFVWQNGGELVDSPENPRKSTLSTPEAQGALQFLLDLRAKHKVAPEVELTMGNGGVDAFARGQVALGFAGRWHADRLAKSDFPWDTLPLPRGKVAANLGSGSGFCLVKGARHADEAWKLMSYLAGTDGQKEILNGGFSTPARQSLVNSEYFALGMTAIGAKAFTEGLKSMRPLPFTPRYAQISAVWDRELARLWSGEATVQEVTQRIDAEVDKILSEAPATAAWLMPLTPRL